MLSMGLLIVAVVGYLAAIGCLLWWPGMAQVVLKCTICALIFACVLIVAALVLIEILETKVLAKISETKGE